MVNASELIHFSLFPLKQDPPVISGRTLRFVNAPLPTAPHGSAPMVPVQGVPFPRETHVVPCNPPVMVRALPVAMLTTVLVSHPPATPCTKLFWPFRVGRL